MQFCQRKLKMIAAAWCVPVHLRRHGKEVHDGFGVGLQVSHLIAAHMQGPVAHGLFMELCLDRSAMPCVAPPS